METSVKGARGVWRRFRSWPWWAQAGCALLVLGVLFGPFVSEDESTPTAAAPAPGSSSPAAGTPTRAPGGGSPAAVVSLPPLSVPIEGCQPADPALVERVEAGLTGDAVALRLAYTVEDAGRTYLGASMFNAEGQRLSSADTWIIEGEQVYALSGTANEFSDFPDGRDLPDNPSAGIGAPLQLQERCTIPATGAG